MINLLKVTKIYNENKHNECIAVKNINLEIMNNSLTVFYGPSGSGKTTLLSLIGAMMRPTEGRIFFNSKEITSLPERFLSIFRRENIGFIFQKFNLLKNLTVIQNVIMPLLPSGISRKDAEKKAIEVLDRLNIKKLAYAKSEWLSGGEAQRVAIARALINNPKVIIADEPTANLDTENSKIIVEILKDLINDGKTIVVASHDPIIYESKYVTQIFKMRDGKIIRND